METKLTLLMVTFSENYIFGKFEAFCKRLKKIADVITTIESLSSLSNIKLEGLESITVKYKTIVETIKKKNYDILDHRKSDVIFLDQSLTSVRACGLTLLLISSLRTITMSSRTRSRLFNYSCRATSTRGTATPIR